MKKVTAHHVITKGGGRVAARKRKRPYMTAHSEVKPSPLPCLFHLIGLPRGTGDGYILIVGL